MAANTSSAPPLPPQALQLAEQALSRAGGTPLIGGNAVDLLIDARENFDAWLAAIRRARESVLLENYIVCDDVVGREFRDALRERAAAGVRVRVIRDWLGCLGNSREAFWKPLRDAGGEVRAYNPPRFDNPLGWLSRDHRKLLVTDGSLGFVSGICIAAKWLGDAQTGVTPWRDTGVAIRGPALVDMVAAFADTWSQLGAALDIDLVGRIPATAGSVDLRVVAERPSHASLFRTDQLIAAMARKNLWLTDAYFVGFAPYVQALIAAARDGVDVRLLVPGTSNLKLVARLSHAGYRPLLEAGIKVYEWNGSMLHAKTAVADGRWARIGSSNLNISSWMANCELDIAVENAGFAQQLAAQYEKDLENATEIVLAPARTPARVHAATRPRRGGGSSSRAAAGALRLANTIGAAISDRRVLGIAEAGLLPGATVVLVGLAIVAALWPRLVAWPFAVIALWLGASLLARYFGARRALATGNKDGRH
ncbi:MAG: phospholipase D-like domain-containing protein [Rudaea sp.]|nr:phospholipase D-like domain-containing protein [Rudaea sp.]